VGLGGEVRRLDLGEVAELADEDHAEGGEHFTQPRGRVLARRLALTFIPRPFGPEMNNK